MSSTRPRRGLRHRPALGALVAALATMIGQLNRVGIAHGLEPDEAHDPVNRDAALPARIAALRAA